MNEDISPWHDLTGVLVRVSRVSSKKVRIVVRVTPRLLTLVIPANKLVGKIPSPGNKIMLLRTDKDFRVRARARYLRDDDGGD